MNSNDSMQLELERLRAENDNLKRRSPGSGEFDSSFSRLMEMVAMQSERELVWARREHAFAKMTRHWLPPLFVLIPVFVGLLLGGSLVLLGR
ncbi:hypothetical protein [Oceaniglobus roseus]|uniref:hypothetical protein n=1 Tax=Oceaniglobus roseus TaxID=1737570 RepID=UPI000C7F5E8A|nr:hypothetical protein [Kandeliimicrobium roseum]